MYYTDEFIDKIENEVLLDKAMYANIQAHNEVVEFVKITHNKKKNVDKNIEIW